MQSCNFRESNVGLQDLVPFLPFLDIDLAGLDVGFQFDEQKKAQLNGVNLSSSYLVDSNFSGARLFNSNFETSYLYGADFSFSDLRNAKMKGAFSGESKYIDSFTNFVGADLSNADLSDHDGGLEWLKNNYDPYEGKAIKIGGSFLLDADLRGTKLGNSIIGGNLKLAKLIGHAEKKFLENFPIYNILSAHAWDKNTEFPDYIAAFLTAYKMRDGKPKKGDRGYKIVKEARADMLQVLKQTRLGHRQFFRYIHEKAFYRRFEESDLESLKIINDALERGN